MTNIFKYKYNISIMFMVTLVINTFISIHLIKTSVSEFLFVNFIIVGGFLLSIKNKRDRKRSLITYNGYENINTFTVMTLIICITATLISTVFYLGLFNLTIITQYTENIAVLPIYAAILIGFIKIKEFPKFLMFLANPNNLILMMSDKETTNQKIEKELRKVLRLFNNKSIQFEHIQRPHSIGDFIFIDLSNVGSFKIHYTKNKTAYRFDKDLFYVNNRSFNKKDLYSYLRSSQLKIDTMTHEDWQLAEMYLIR